MDKVPREAEKEKRMGGTKRKEGGKIQAKKVKNHVID